MQRGRCPAAHRGNRSEATQGNAVYGSRERAGCCTHIRLIQSLPLTAIRHAHVSNVGWPCSCASRGAANAHALGHTRVGWQLQLELLAYLPREAAGGK
jgi:hypothetical protein